jgi:N-acetylglutamate synthase-like GNAT family acetyltransferase
MPATREDARHIAALLRRQAPGTVPICAGEIRAGIDRYRVVRRAGRAVATAAVHPAAEGRLELRSVAVDEACCGQGLGTLLVGAAQAEARGRGRDLVCVTASPGFFARLGFEEAPGIGVPPRSDRQRPHGGERVAMRWRASAGDEGFNDVSIPLRKSA